MEEIKVITLDDGTRVEVSTKIYQEYYRPQWREEKCQQRDAKRLLSSDYEYGSGEGDSVTMQDFMTDPDQLTPEEQIIKNEEHKLLQEALSILSEEKRALIEALFFDGKSEREYADEVGMARTTLNYQRKKALEEMHTYMKKHL